MSSERVKYPRTVHLPWSPGKTRDDHVMTDEDYDQLIGEMVVVTEKMDGENTTMYRDAVHARSLDSADHPSRHWLKGYWSSIRYMIPEGVRICGENVFARHSIEYQDLESWFLAFGVWNGQLCWGWDDTVELIESIGMKMVPVCYRGRYGPNEVRKATLGCREGYVVRVEREFMDWEFRSVVGKYVRRDHVQTDEHWMKGAVVVNGLKDGN